jgi:hypothetical protein
MHKLYKTGYILIIFISQYFCASGQNVILNNKGEVGIYLKYINIDEGNASFYADLYWWITIKADSEFIRKDSIAAFNQYDSSFSQLEFINAIEIKSNEIQESKWIWKNGERYFYKTGNLKSSFNFIPDFRKYPIDNQELPIIIESPLLTADMLELKPEVIVDSSKKFIDKMVEIKGYTIDKVFGKSINNNYSTDFGDKYTGFKHYSRLTYTLDIKRNYLSYFLKIFLPNILLLVIAYLVFFIPAKELEVAVGCTVTSLLASIALKLTIDNNLPNVGYTTYSDELFYLFYFMITGALVQTVITYNFNKAGKHKAEYYLELFGRIFYPITLILGFWLILR